MSKTETLEPGYRKACLELIKEIYKDGQGDLFKIWKNIKDTEAAILVYVGLDMKPEEFQRFCFVTLMEVADTALCVYNKLVATKNEQKT